MNPQTSTYCPKFPGVFGSVMPVFGVFEGGNYLFGYQSSIKDNELCGDGNAYSTYFRELDVRLGRWFAIDPKTSATPWESPYVSMGDNPDYFIDPNGDSWKERRKNIKQAKEFARITKGKFHRTGHGNAEVDLTGTQYSKDANFGDLGIIIFPDGVRSIGWNNGRQHLAVFKKGEDYSKRMENVRSWMAIQRIKNNFSPTTIDGWINKHIAGNENSDYKGYAAVNLDVDKGITILTSEVSLFTGGAGYFIKGATIGAKIYSTLNVIDAVDDISGLGEKMVNGNKIASTIYFGTKAVLCFTDKTFTSLEVVNGAKSALNYLSILNNEYKTIDNTIKALKKGNNN